MRWIAVVVSLCALPGRAERCRLDGSTWIVGRIGGGAAARSVDARRGETVTASVVASGTLDGRRVLFSDAPGPRHVPWRQPG